MGTALGIAAIGALAGALLPKVIACLPDRTPAAGTPPPTPYRVLAAAPHLGLSLAVLTSASWAVLVLTLGIAPELPAYLFAALLGVAMAYVDIREHRLPDRFTYSAVAGASVLLLVAAATTADWHSYTRAWLGAVVLVAGFFLMALVQPGAVGLGDVKLVASVGLLLGWLDWTHLSVAMMLSFASAGLYATGLLVARRAGRHSHLPFGPFLLAGALGSIVWATTLIDALAGR